MHIGEQIKLFRDENDMTIEEFAKIVGLNRGTIMNYEHGQSKPRSMSRINKVLNLSAEELEAIRPQKEPRKRKSPQKAKLESVVARPTAPVRRKKQNGLKSQEYIIGLVDRLSDEQKGLLIGYIDALLIKEMMEE